MKTIKHFIFALLLLSCDNYPIENYSVEQKVRTNAVSLEVEHATYVWLNNEIIKSWKTPIEDVTCESVKENRLKAEALVKALKECDATEN